MAISMLSFILSFCSMSYELILGKAFYLVGFDERVSYTVTVSVYLLGLGLGSLCSRKKKDPLKSLFNVELILTAFGASAIVLIWFFASYLKIMLHYPLSTILPKAWEGLLLLFLLQTFVLLLGYLSGKELNCLLFWSEKRHNSEGLILGLTYLGGLLSSVVVTFVLLTSMNEIQSIFIISSLNMLMAGFLLIFILSIKNVLKISLVFLYMAFLSSYLPVMSDFLIKAQYFDSKVLRFPNVKDHYNIYKQITLRPSVERYRSKYQVLDFVFNDSKDFTLYLNKRPQFYTKSIDGYHQSMVYGLINLSDSVPSSVLVLGGGDGLLVKELLNVPKVSSIELVDLDPQMLKLAKTHPRLKKLNQSSLTNEKVKVYTDDAFVFLKETNNKWDAIFIDFPVPYTFDLSRLYSTEFYRLVKNSLRDDGSAIFDAPFFINIKGEGEVERSEAIDILGSTLSKAGFKNWTGFGVYEGFIFFNKKDQRKSFQYEKLPLRLSGEALVNMVELDTFYPHSININVRENSIFAPRKFNAKKY